MYICIYEYMYIVYTYMYIEKKKQNKLALVL